MARSQMFTPRETHIIELLEIGMSDKEIAYTLDRSPRTIQTHIGRCFLKHEARNRTHLVHKFHQWKNKKGNENG